MIEALIKALFWLVTQIFNIIFLPISLLFDNLFPDLSSYLDQITDFLDDYFWDVLAFVKRVFVNFGFAQGLFSFIIIWLTFKITLLAGVKVYVFARNCWRNFKAN